MGPEGLHVFKSSTDGSESHGLLSAGVLKTIGKV